jgi:hypothetical protein
LRLQRQDVFSASPSDLSAIVASRFLNQHWKFNWISKNDSYSEWVNPMQQELLGQSMFAGFFHDCLRSCTKQLPHFGEMEFQAPIAMAFVDLAGEGSPESAKTKDGLKQLLLQAIESH